jgi:hypothetical protein
VGTGPTLSWQPPALGTPSGYIVTLYYLVPAGTGTSYNVLAIFRTTQAGMQLPSGSLTPGYTYVFKVTAIQQNRDMLAAPFRLSLPRGTADVLSGMITP